MDSFYIYFWKFFRPQKFKKSFQFTLNWSLKFRKRQKTAKKEEISEKAKEGQ